MAAPSSQKGSMIKYTDVKGQKKGFGPFGELPCINVRTQTSTHLCDVLNKVLAEGKSAANEPHSDHMVSQGYDVLVEPGGNE